MTDNIHTHTHTHVVPMDSIDFDFDFHLTDSVISDFFEGDDDYFDLLVGEWLSEDKNNTENNKNNTENGYEDDSSFGDYDPSLHTDTITTANNDDNDDTESHQDGDCCTVVSAPETTRWTFTPPQPSQEEVGIVTVKGQFDVICGRTNHESKSSPGNHRYRQLVDRFKSAYKAASKRIDKQRIAEKVKDMIAMEGGRFVQKVVVWTDETTYEHNDGPVPTDTKVRYVLASRGVIHEKVTKDLRRKPDHRSWSGPLSCVRRSKSKSKTKKKKG